MTLRYEIRAATSADHDDLLTLAGYLDSVNLPHDETAIRDLCDVSERSFSGAIKDARRREYGREKRIGESRESVCCVTPALSFHCARHSRSRALVRPYQGRQRACHDYDSVLNTIALR